MDPANPASSEHGKSLVDNVFSVGALHLIGGSRGAGKTAFECWMTSKILKGEDFLGHKTRMPPWYGVLVMDRDSEDRLEWMQTVGTKPDAIYSLTDDPKIRPEHLVDMQPRQAFVFLQQRVKELDPVPGGLLVVDVLNFFTGPPQMSYQTSFAFGWGLNKIAHKHNVCMIGLMHGGKQKALDRYVRATDRIIAPTGFLGAVGTVSYLTTPEESGDRGYQEFTWEPHHWKPEHFWLGRTQNGLYEVLDGPPQTAGQPDKGHKGEGIKPEAKPPGEVLAQRLQEYLEFFPPHGSNYWISTQEVIRRAAERWGYHEVTVHNHLRDLKLLGLIINFEGHRGMWQKAGEDAEAGS